MPGTGAVVGVFFLRREPRRGIYEKPIAELPTATADGFVCGTTPLEGTRACDLDDNLVIMPCPLLFGSFRLSLRLLGPCRRQTRPEMRKFGAAGAAGAPTARRKDPCL